MTAVMFKGSLDDLCRAEVWCRHGIDYCYSKTKMADGRFRFTFHSPYDAQMFIDAHRTQATQIYE